MFCQFFPCFVPFRFYLYTYTHYVCACVSDVLYTSMRVHGIRLLWPFLLNFVYFICVIALWCTFINTKWSSYDFLSKCEKGTYEDKKQKIHVLVHVYVWHIMWKWFMLASTNEWENERGGNDFPVFFLSFSAHTHTRTHKSTTTQGILIRIPLRFQLTT